MLAAILDNKREEVKEAKKRVPLTALRERAGSVAPPLSMLGRITEKEGARHRIIAEIKRASPSKGVLRQDLDPVEWAGRYQRAGATALSVLTDERFFKGSLTHLEQVRDIVQLPVLRKDFIIDAYQVHESRASGADVVLLIVRALDPAQFRELMEVTREIGMEALVEIHDEMELDRALDQGVRLLGINNRDLKTFNVDISVTERLMDRIPDDVVVVSASGIHSPEQILRLEAKGAKAFLIGEALVTAADPEEKLKELVSWRG